jgi:hypothetical protein
MLPQVSKIVFIEEAFVVLSLRTNSRRQIRGVISRSQTWS